MIAKPKTKIIILRETLGQHIVRDFVSYVLLALMLWFNYTFVGGSYFMNSLILFFLILRVLHTYNRQDRLSISEAIKELEQIKLEDTQHDH